MYARVMPQPGHGMSNKLKKGQDKSKTYIIRITIAAANVVRILSFSFVIFILTPNGFTLPELD